MDLSNLSPADGLEAIHQNGVHEESSNSGNGVVSNNVDPNVTEIVETVALNGILEIFDKSDSNVTDNSSMGATKEGSNDTVDGNNATISMEEEVKIIDKTVKSRAQKGPIKNKIVKPPSARVIHSSLVKKSKDGKGGEAPPAVSNRTLALDSNPRQPIKNKSFNDKQTQNKHPGKPDAASSKAPKQKTEPRSLKKGPLPDNVQGESESSSPTEQDAKPRKVGALPNYGFSFKCDERAERRKKFYTELEEKIHAKEVEESNLQAKTKESQEAEIKRLRQNLAFKATPMPTFYQEPPPRVELKKIPTTRAKSPKLGRRKSSTSAESEGNTSSSARLGHLSLDEKVSQSKPAKAVTPVHQRKPQRKSLPPRLNSERISSSDSATAPTSSKAVDDENASLSKATLLSNATEDEKVEMAAGNEENNALSNETTSDKPSEAESYVNSDIVIEEKPDIVLVPEPIAAEH
ncbi:hypothetical protein Lal_00002250 [Lupinus albus]|uniref:TPX2 C-terminal domain-containing protein n=1 Tax=Lupinus albus TaxID=3870 RepID=A0A6A4PQ29_LUPAL|nr:hypothetical protein Lalb_Chr11g0063731 [Lupinus albus]KAF1893731.1 hypothetical protein Lal_00002250 [Lupinus albus]